MKNVIRGGLKLAFFPVTGPFWAMMATERLFGKGVDALFNRLSRVVDPDFDTPQNIPARFENPPLSEEARASKIEEMASLALNRFVRNLQDDRPLHVPGAIEAMKQIRWNESELAMHGISHTQLVGYMHKHQARLVAEHPMEHVRRIAFSASTIEGSPIDLRR